MTLFGLGAALPLVVLGQLSRRTLLMWRIGLQTVGRGLKLTMGATLILLSSIVLSGLDKMVEAVLVAASPDWLSDLTSRF